MLSFDTVTARCGAHSADIGISSELWSSGSSLPREKSIRKFSHVLRKYCLRHWDLVTDIAISFVSHHFHAQSVGELSPLQQHITSYSKLWIRSFSLLKQLSLLIWITMGKENKLLKKKKNIVLTVLTVCHIDFTPLQFKLKTAKECNWPKSNKSIILCLQCLQT